MKHERLFCLSLKKRNRIGAAPRLFSSLKNLGNKRDAAVRHSVLKRSCAAPIRYVFIFSLFAGGILESVHSQIKKYQRYRARETVTSLDRTEMVQPDESDSLRLVK